jgi:hypothetical protein
MERVQAGRQRRRWACGSGVHGARCTCRTPDLRSPRRSFARQVRSDQHVGAEQAHARGCMVARPMRRRSPHRCGEAANKPKVGGVRVAHERERHQPPSPQHREPPSRSRGSASLTSSASSAPQQADSERAQDCGGPLHAADDVQALQILQDAAPAPPRDANAAGQALAAQPSCAGGSVCASRVDKGTSAMRRRGLRADSE